MSNSNSRRMLAPKQGLGAAAESSVLLDGAIPSASHSKPKRQTVKAACNACQRRKVKVRTHNEGAPQLIALIGRSLANYITD